MSIKDEKLLFIRFDFDYSDWYDWLRDSCHEFKVEAGLSIVDFCHAESPDKTAPTDCKIALLLKTSKQGHNREVDWSIHIVSFVSLESKAHLAAPTCPAYSFSILNRINLDSASLYPGVVFKRIILASELNKVIVVGVAPKKNEQTKEVILADFYSTEKQGTTMYGLATTKPLKHAHIEIPYLPESVSAKDLKMHLKSNYFRLVEPCFRQAGISHCLVSFIMLGRLTKICKLIYTKDLEMLEITPIETVLQEPGADISCYLLRSDGPEAKPGETVSQQEGELTSTLQFYTSANTRYQVVSALKLKDFLESPRTRSRTQT